LRGETRKERCGWATNHPLLLEYHDKEWGVPVHDDRKLFELLVLEGAQAGLNWMTVLMKRENYRKDFADFDPEKIAKFTKRDATRLLKDPGIIRNRLKIMSAITNAQKCLEIKGEFGSFDKYIWQFVGGKPIKNRYRRLSEIPSKTRESDAMSEDLQKRGFRFVGSTICYSFMQAVGMVNDHTSNCFRYSEV
jgi:DNA-3-methyladenine glycosylase I